MSSSFLITGGLGGLGGSLVTYILKNTAARIAVLDNLSSPSYGTFADERVQLYRGDTCNEGLIGYILKENSVDTVIDCSSRATPKTVLEAANVLKNFTHLLEAVRAFGSLKHFVLASRPQRPKESQPLCPGEFGLASLMAAESMLHSYVISYRLPLVTARVAVVAEHLSDYSNLSGFVNLISGNDAARGVLAALGGEPAGVYNICGPSDFDAFELKKEGVHGVPPRETLFDTSKAKEELCFSATEDLTKGGTLQSDGLGLEKVLIFGNGAVLGELKKALANEGVMFVESTSKPGKDDDKTVIDELTRVAPSHVICVSNEDVDEGSGSACEKLYISTYSLLFPPWHLASLCEKRGIHFTFVGGADLFAPDQLENGPISETVDGKSQETNLGAVRTYTEKLIRHFPGALQIRFDGADSSIDKLAKLVLTRETGVWNFPGPKSHLDGSKLLQHFE